MCGIWVFGGMPHSAKPGGWLLLGKTCVLHCIWPKLVGLSANKNSHVFVNKSGKQVSPIHKSTLRRLAYLYGDSTVNFLSLEHQWGRGGGVKGRRGRGRVSHKNSQDYNGDVLIQAALGVNWTLETRRHISLRLPSDGFLFACAINDRSTLP